MSALSAKSYQHDDGNTVWVFDIELYLDTVQLDVVIEQTAKQCDWSLFHSLKGYIARGSASTFFQAMNLCEEYGSAWASLAAAGQQNRRTQG